MLQVAICDDQTQELNEVTTSFVEYAHLHPEAALELRPFQSGHILLEYVRAQGSFLIYLLDMTTPNLNGLTLGAVIREDDPDTVIIYFTSSPDYAVDSFSVQVSGYLLKPMERTTLFAQLDRVLNKLSWEQGVLMMKARDRVSLIRPSDIRYVGGTNHTATFYLSRGWTVAAIKRGSFHEAVAPLLDDGRLLRVGTSLLVNILYVDSTEWGCFLMQEGGKILAPRLKRSEVQDRFLDLSLRRGLNL